MSRRQCLPGTPHGERSRLPREWQPNTLDKQRDNTVDAQLTQEMTHNWILNGKFELWLFFCFGLDFKLIDGYIQMLKLHLLPPLPPPSTPPPHTRIIRYLTFASGGIISRRTHSKHNIAPPGARRGLVALASQGEKENLQNALACRLRRASRLRTANGADRNLKILGP